jgi:hypothetical protein
MLHEYTPVLFFLFYTRKRGGATKNGMTGNAVKTAIYDIYCKNENGYDRGQKAGMKEESANGEEDPTGHHRNRLHGERPRLSGGGRGMPGF